MCLHLYSRLNWWAEQHWLPSICKKCKWEIVGEMFIHLPTRSPFSQRSVFPFLCPGGTSQGHSLTYDAAISSLCTWSSSGHRYYIGHPGTTLTKKVDQMCSCCSNWAITVILFKTSSLGLPRVPFICTVPTIIFQWVEFLIRQHLQKLLHFWLYLLNISPGKGNWL